MSRVVKGGAKFKPVARARPAVPSSQPASQPAAPSQPAQPIPPSSQIPSSSLSSTQASSIPSATAPVQPSLPPSSSSASTSTSTASRDKVPSASSTSTSDAIPIPPARAYNPFLYGQAPPPIILREPVRTSSSSTAPGASLASNRQQGGREAPTIASTAGLSSDRRAGSVVPTIATTSGPPPSPGGVRRAQVPPTIASTSAWAAPVVATSSTHTGRAPTLATTSSSMAPPPRPTASSSRVPANGRAPPLATTRASPPPVASSSTSRATASPVPIVPRLSGMVPPSQPSVASPPVSSEREGFSPPPPSSNVAGSFTSAASALPLASRSVPRGVPAPTAAADKGKKRAAPAVAAATDADPPVKKPRGQPSKMATAQVEETSAAVAEAEVEGEEQGARALVAEASSSTAPRRGRVKKGAIVVRPPPIVIAKRNGRLIVDSEEELEIVSSLGAMPVKKRKAPDSDGRYGSDASGPDETIQLPRLPPKRRYVRKPKDPNAPPKQPKKKVERDADGNKISNYSRRQSKEVPLGPDGLPLPKLPRVRKPRPPTGRPIGRPKKPIEVIEDIDVEEHNALAGDGPDVLTTMMKDICEDTGMGRISSRFVEIQRKAQDLKLGRKAARERMKARLAKARNPDEVHSEDEDGPLTVEEGGNVPDGEYVKPKNAAGSAAALDQLALEAKVAAKEAKRAANETAGLDPPDEDEDEDDIDNVAEGGYAPQFRLVNGEMVLDQESLEVDRHAEVAAAIDEDMDVVEERDTDRFVNTTTWGKKLRGERWSKEETDLFFIAINQFGTDFEMIARLFPGRTRKMIKNKWNREEVSNATRVTEALLMKVPVDVAEYSRMTQIDLSGPPPEINMPAPPSEPATPRNASAGPFKPGKKKRPNFRDGEEIAGQIGADGEEIRYDDEKSDHEEVRSRKASSASTVPEPSFARAGSSAPLRSGGSGSTGAGPSRPRPAVDVAAVGAGVVGRKAPTLSVAAPEPAPAPEKENLGPPDALSDDEDLPAAGAIGRR